MLFVGIVGLGVLITLVGSASTGRRVFLVFHGFETNKYGLVARLEFTNSTRWRVSYEGNPYRPEYRLVEASYREWKETDNTKGIVHLGTLASVPRPRSLLPSSGLVFLVRIPPSSQELTARKVELTYSYARPTNGLWKVMPKWIWTRLPWGKDMYALESPPFSL